MKNFTKKRGFFAVAAVLLAITAMLVTTGCGNDIGDEFVLPEGKGAVKLSFNNEIARTILPDDASITSFGEFEFVFTATSVGATSYTKSHVLFANLQDPITLDPGNYNLQIIGYLDIDPSATVNLQPAATNNPVEPITITPAQVTNATIVLKPYAQDVGTVNGTFKYNIISTIAAANITTAVMNLTSIFAGTNQLVDIKTVWGDGTGSTVAVKAGDYYLDFVITIKTGETITFRHIINIYQNMTSSYDFTINPNYFNAVFQLVTGQPTYAHPSDKLPELKYNDGTDHTVAEGGDVEVTQGSNNVVISVTNGGTLGFTSYEWFSVTTTSLGATSSLTVNTTAAPFTEKRTYLLTVVGVTSSGEKYYTFINIIVK